MGGFSQGLGEGMGVAVGFIVGVILLIFIIVVLVYWGLKTGTIQDFAKDSIKSSLGL